MSQMLNLDFIKKYRDCKKKYPKCGNELIRGISCSDSQLDESQYCKCGWNQKVYHKYFEEKESKAKNKQLYIKCTTSDNFKFGFKICNDIKINNDEIELSLEGKEVDDLIELIINDVQEVEGLKNYINKIKNKKGIE